MNALQPEHTTRRVTLHEYAPSGREATHALCKPAGDAVVPRLLNRTTRGCASRQGASNTALLETRAHQAGTTQALDDYAFPRFHVFGASQLLPATKSGRAHSSCNKAAAVAKCSVLTSLRSNTQVPSSLILTPQFSSESTTPKEQVDQGLCWE